MVLKYNLKDCVKFIGWVKDKKEFFDSIDIFCLPSIAEPFGIIALEVMLFNKPIVAAEAEGPREIITHMKDGLLVPVGSVQSMADSIEKLIDNPKLRTQLADRASLTVRELYDINIVGKKLANYLHIIKKSHEI
jgi:glycosyltransferase involved in cell wall biosynthesis